MSHPPSPIPPAHAASLSPGETGQPTILLERRFWPSGMTDVRGDLQQDTIDLLKPVDNNRLKEGMPDTEFNRKYPPDAWCEEAAPNARVWKICKDEATVSDRGMLESWNQTLDVLLIFAGLFSAVSTAFIIESYKALQPDYSQYVAMFLYSAAVAYNNSGSTLPPLDAIQSPQGSFHSASLERWINGLWFISLTISLLVALLSILVKQWLDEYRARVFRSAPDHAYWARRRALFNDGLHSWGIPVIISCLPLLLHVSLFLFLAGLVLFLRLLDQAIAYVVVALVALMLGLYLLSMILPAFYVQCPSKTPVQTHALRAWLVCTSWLQRSSACWIPTSALRRVAALLALPARVRNKGASQRIEDAENELDAIALAELANRTDDPDILSVAAEALAQFPPRSLEILMHDQTDAYNRLRQSISHGRRITANMYTSVFAAASFARCQRADMALSNASSRALYLQGIFLPGAPDLRVALGIEGALLSALQEWEPSFTLNQGAVRILI